MGAVQYGIPGSFFLVELLLLKPWPKSRLILYAAEHIGETFFLDYMIHLLV
jgi:hypothetical protein